MKIHKGRGAAYPPPEKSTLSCSVNNPYPFFRLVFVLGVLLFPLWLGAQSTISQSVRAFALDPELAGAAISIDVVDVATGQRVAAHQPEMACIPASTQKLLTTAAAMDILGPDHRFETKLFITGDVVDGELRGDLYIVGGGDPSLGSPFLKGVPGLEAILERWRSAVQRAGITRINGRVIGDGSYWNTDATPGDWPYSDIGNYYGAGAYGLSIHENLYFLDFLQRSRVGSQPPIQQTRPQVPGLHLINELRSGPRGSGDQAYVYGSAYNYQNYVRGTIPVGSKRFTIKGAIPDPPLFTAQALCRKLEAVGIDVALPAESHRTLGGGRYLEGREIDVYESPELSVLVDRTNLRSLNLYAEALLREVNKSRGLEDHELGSGKVLKDWLAGQGLNPGPINVEDGSGLGTRNFFPAEFMTAFLRTQVDNDRWRASIPLAGRTGSMRGFLKGTAAEGRLSAKSGSLNSARAYAGYARRKDGRELAFAIMVNNYTIEGKSLRNKMMVLMRELCSGRL